MATLLWLQTGACSGVGSLLHLLPASAVAAAPPALPEVPEPQIIRHYLNLSTLNMSVDTHFYPLGSCTMKYNPKQHERLAKLPGIVGIDDFTGKAFHTTRWDYEYTGGDANGGRQVLVLVLVALWGVRLKIGRAHV